MEKEHLIFKKESLQFIRLDKNKYKLTFLMENKNILISSIIDFTLIKLICELNSDIYEKYSIENINNNEIICTLLMKNFFEDLGFLQNYSHLHIQKFYEEKKVIFKSHSIHSEKPDTIPDDAELLSIKEMTNICEIITPHIIHFSFYINFEQNVNIPNFAEKMVGIVLNKIFNRVKQFIENITL